MGRRAFNDYDDNNNKDDDDDDDDNGSSNKLLQSSELNGLSCEICADFVDSCKQFNSTIFTTLNDAA